MSKTVKIAVDHAEYHINLPDMDTDYIQGKIAREEKPYELAMLRDIASHLTDESLVLDIGANIGNHALYLAVVSGCKVYAFEPNAHLCLALDESIKENHLQSKIKVFQNGVGAAIAKAHFANINRENLGAQSLDVSNQSQDDIDIVTIDETIQEKVDVIKIDVEGMELEVLKGAQKTIEKYRPFIYVESLTEQEFNNIVALLTPLGYCYWDTFNATPTHLFLHSSLVTQEQRFERLLIKSARNEYRAAQTVISLREKLADANSKYRIASERIHDLKEKLESAHAKYRDSSSALVALKKKYEEEHAQYKVNIADLESQLLQLEEQLDSKSRDLVSSNTVKKDLEVSNNELNHRRNELLAQLSTMTARYESANTNYLQVLKQLNSVQRERLEENRRYHQEKLDLLVSTNEIKKATEAAMQKLKAEVVASHERQMLLNSELDSEKNIKQSILEQLTVLQEKNHVLQEQHSEEQNKLEELRRNNAVLLEKISALQSGNQSLQQQSAEEQKRLEELSRNNAVSLEKLSAVQNNNQSLLAQSTEAQKKMEELRRNKAVLQEKLLTIQRNHQSLQEQYDEKVNHNEVLFKKIESLLIEVQVLEEKNEGAEIEIVKMNDSLDESREVKSELEAQIQELAQKLNAISKTNEQLKGQLSAVSSRYQHVADTEVPTLKQQVGTLHEKN